MKLVVVAGFLLVASVGGGAARQEPDPLASLAAERTSHRAGRTDCDRARGLRVLFIGNSYTYVHNVPRLVREVASSLPGPCIETAMVASGGATLEDHWRSDSVAARIRDGGWTHVVLNDQSSFGEGWWLEGRARVGTSGRELAEFGGRFAQVIHAAGATPVLLAHWADAHMPARDQQALDYLFAGTARETRSVVAPVGPAIRRMQAGLPALTPYFNDGHHLSPAGAYLEALVIYSVLTDRSPLGATHRIDGPAVELDRGIVLDSVVTLVDLPAAEAAAIQRIVAAVLAEGRARVPTAPEPLSAEFPRVLESREVPERRALSGRWRGMSRVLPNPAGDSVAIELSLGAAGQPGSGDTLHLRAGELRFAGPATLAIEGTRVVVRAPVLPQGGRFRSPPPPLAVELQAVIQGGVMTGVATIQQRFAGTTASFDAIGRFEARRVGPPD